MTGLIKDTAFTVFIVLLAHGVYDVDDVDGFNFIVDFISKHQTALVGTGVFCLILLLALSAVFETIGLYKITYGLSKILVRLSQFLISFLSLLNMIFYIAMGGNLLFGSGFLTIFLLFLILGASCWTIRVNDFNYHSMNAMAPIGVLATMSVLFVNFIWPMMGL